MPPPRPPRPGSSPRLPVTEVLAPGAVHEYRPPIPPFDERATIPPIPHDDVPRAIVRPRVPTQTGMPAPPSEPPMRDSKRDSGEVRTDTLLDELYQRDQARRQAEARAAELERQLEVLLAKRVEAEPETLRPRAPSLGNAKWWLVALGTVGTLAATIVAVLEIATKLRDWRDPPASAAQVAEIQVENTKRAEAQAKKDELDQKRRDNEDQRARLLGAFMCALGFRADGLDCDSALKRVDFEQQPLNPNKVRSAPTWKTRAPWPAPPDPKE